MITMIAKIEKFYQKKTLMCEKSRNVPLLIVKECVSPYIFYEQSDILCIKKCLSFSLSGRCGKAGGVSL